MSAGRRPAGAVPILVAAPLLVSALAGCGPSAPTGHAELDPLGVWMGPADASGNGVLRMDVSEASGDGTGFGGDLTYSMRGDEATGPLHARLTPHGHLVAGVGGDATVELHISGPTTLDYCFMGYGTAPVYVCGRLVKSP